VLVQDTAGECTVRSKILRYALPVLLPSARRDGGGVVFALSLLMDGAKGGSTMAKQIHWETSLTTAKTKAKKEGKLILLDFYNSL
jgi:hypothetical protein